MLSQYQKIQLQARMTSISRCLNTFPKPPWTHFYIFSTVYGQQEVFQRLAEIIPIPEPEKDHAEPTNYRAKALTSCLCKTLERMINKRLVWYLESNNLITKFQSGFRAERSTNDNLVRLEIFIRDAFIKREHVAVFFHLEKAYDTTWRYGILKDLHNFGLKGRLPNFIKSFLEDRTIQVRVGSTLSDLYDQEQGVPQGAILSIILCNVKLNDIINCLDYKTDGSLYVDELCICFRSKNMRTIERHLQQCLNRIEEMASDFPDRKLSAFISVNYGKYTTDYGSIVNGSARKSYLQMLDTVHHQGLRLALGAFVRLQYRVLL